MPVIDNSKYQNSPALQRQANSRIFQDIWRDAMRQGLTAKNSTSSSDWFRDKAAKMGKDVKPEDLMFDQSRLTNTFEWGSMYSYFYIPKYKDDPYKLPYYDIFPLVFPIEPAPKGFYGINLHYLPPDYRAALMDKLFDLKNNNRFDASTKLVLSYQILKGTTKLSAFKPCFKHYLYKHVYSKFLTIESFEWNIALFLPTERFIRATKQAVWKDSRKKV